MVPYPETLNTAAHPPQAVDILVKMINTQTMR